MLLRISGSGEDDCQVFYDQMQSLWKSLEIIILHDCDVRHVCVPARTCQCVCVCVCVQGQL